MTRLSDLALKVFRANNNEVVGIGGRANKTIQNLSKFKKLKNEKSKNLTRVGALEEPTFLTLDAKKALNCLWQAFIKAPILRHFDPKCYI